MTTDNTQEMVDKMTLLLAKCPFCGGTAEFVLNKSEQLFIQHVPDRGINCPVRYEQYCESFQQGFNWWNKRI